VIEASNIEFTVAVDDYIIVLYIVLRKVVLSRFFGHAFHQHPIFGFTIKGIVLCKYSLKMLSLFLPFAKLIFFANHIG